jgi:hypothetical protein
VADLVAGLPAANQRGGPAMQALSSIGKKIVVFTEGIGPSVKNWGQRLQLKKWWQWVGGKSPMPDKRQRVALASTATAALVVVVVLVVGASMVLKSPSHPAPKTAQNSTANGSYDADSDPNAPDLSDFENSDPSSGSSGSSGAAATSSKGTHSHAKAKASHSHPGARKSRVSTTAKVKTTRPPRTTTTRPSRSGGRTRTTPRHSSQTS